MKAKADEEASAGERCPLDTAHPLIVKAKSNAKRLPGLTGAEALKVQEELLKDLAQLESLVKPALLE